MVGYSADTMLRLSWFSGPWSSSDCALQACCALEVDKDRLGAALDDIRPPSAASWPQGNKRSRSAQSSNVAPGPVVADALRRHVLLPDAIYPGFATLWM